MVLKDISNNKKISNENIFTKLVMNKIPYPTLMWYIDFINRI